MLVQPSLAELIVAAGPSAEEVRQKEFLTTRVEQLEAAAAEAETSHSTPR